MEDNVPPLSNTYVAVPVSRFHLVHRALMSKDRLEVIQGLVNAGVDLEGRTEVLRSTVFHIIASTNFVSGDVPQEEKDKIEYLMNQGVYHLMYEKDACGLFPHQMRMSTDFLHYYTRAKARVLHNLLLVLYVTDVANIVLDYLFVRLSEGDIEILTRGNEKISSIHHSPNEGAHKSLWTQCIGRLLALVYRHY